MPGASGTVEGDLFSKLWTYEELLTAERPRGSRNRPENERDLTVPDHWPKDGTTVEPGSWAFWLPDGWGQGIKPTSGGKTLKCYISPPPMKRFFHKPEVQKYCVKMGWPGIKEEEEKAEEKKVKTVHDAPPQWPEWDLPKDWRLAYKQLPTGPHKIYIPPGQDEGFLYHRTCVDQYLKQGKKLTRFDDSKPMAQRSMEAAEKGKIRKKKRRIEATVDDYVECSDLLLVKVMAQNKHETIVAELGMLGVADAENLAGTATQLHSLLAKRGFPSDTELVIVCGKSAAKDGSILGYVCGHYFKLNAETERPVYQKLRLEEKLQTGILCERIYISWSDLFGGCWKIGSLMSGANALAINQGVSSEPVECNSAWKTYQPQSLDRDKVLTSG